MARFSTLITLWERRVEAARQALGRTNAAIQAARSDILDCRRERMLLAVRDPVWRDQYQSFCAWSHEREAAHRHNCAAFEETAERQRVALAEATRRQRTFERLQAREDARLARQERRRQEAELVEHALRRWREVHA